MTKSKVLRILAGYADKVVYRPYDYYKRECDNIRDLVEGTNEEKYVPDYVTGELTGRDLMDMLSADTVKPSDNILPNTLIRDGMCSFEATARWLMFGTLERNAPNNTYIAVEVKESLDKYVEYYNAHKEVIEKKRAESQRSWRRFIHRIAPYATIYDHLK